MRLWRISNAQVNYLESLILVLSPTRLLIHYLKEMGNQSTRTQALRSWNKGLFAIELCLVFILALWVYVYSSSLSGRPEHALPGLRVILAYWAFSRCVEITWAFSSDALRALMNREPSSGIKAAERIIMALRSYFGLLLNFALLYYCLNWEFVGLCIGGFVDALYFSGSVLAGLDLDPKPQLPLAKFFILWQWLAGTFLLVIAVASYLADQGGKGNKRHTAPDASSTVLPMWILVTVNIALAMLLLFFAARSAEAACECSKRMYCGCSVCEVAAPDCPARQI
jgi:hypothetical protein